MPQAQAAVGQNAGAGGPTAGPGGLGGAARRQTTHRTGTQESPPDWAQCAPPPPRESGFPVSGNASRTRSPSLVTEDERTV